MRTPSTFANRKGLISWALYDWANSAFPTVIITFIFGTYFTQGIAVDEITGTSQWGYGMSVSAIFVAVLLPVLGAIADQRGPRKPWLFFFTIVAVVATACLWFARPDTNYVLMALIIAGLANFAFEAGVVFYNSMLPDIAPNKKIGRISGWSWGAGYAGGLCCLSLALIGFVQTEEPWFGVDKIDAANIRATTLLVALWFLTFSMPLFFLTPDKKPTGVKVRVAVYSGIKTLIKTLKQVRHHKDLARYLLARMIYTDGLNTLFAFGGIYAAGTFGFTFTELIQFGIAINVTSGIGAATFAWIDDWVGSKKTIIISIAALTVLSTLILFIETKELFWIFGLMLGIFVGPAQAASRTLMARMAPTDLRTEMFGLYAFSGKATAFLGPAALAFTTDIFSSQRAGMATMVVFFVVGGFLLLTVNENHSASAD